MLHKIFVNKNASPPVMQDLYMDCLKQKYHTLMIKSICSKVTTLFHAAEYEDKNEKLIWLKIAENSTHKKNNCLQ